MRLQEQQIFDKLKRGDNTAYKELFDLYYQPLCIYSLKYLDSIDQAEDIVQETFVRFWNNKSFNTIRGGLRPYLFSAVRNNSLNFIRKNSRFRFEEIENHALDFIDDELDDDELSELKVNLFKEIEALPKKGRDIFKSIVLDNLKYKEVAELYGVSLNTVKTHYSRALSKLRSKLDVLVLILLH